MPNIAYFCYAADRAAANAVAEATGAGPDNFSVPLATAPSVPDGSATHYGGTGIQTQETKTALETSVTPLIQVRDNEGKTWEDHLTASGLYPTVYDEPV